MIQPPPVSTLFPYTTLFRSDSKDLDIFVTPENRPRALAHLESRGFLTKTRSEEHTSELQSRQYLVCRLLLEKKNSSPRTHASRNDRDDNGHRLHHEDRRDAC